MGISTHVLDTARGRPGNGISVTLEIESQGAFSMVGRGVTNADGRITALLAEGTLLQAGVYRLSFELESYFKTLGIDAFYPSASIVFRVKNAAEHFHVPLLLSPFGFSTYRGS